MGKTAQNKTEVNVSSKKRDVNLSDTVPSSGEDISIYSSLGNRSINRILNSLPIQPSLRVNQPGDKYEKEADKVAEQVVSTTPIKSNEISLKKKGVQRKCTSCASGVGSCEECAEEEKVQRKEKPGKSSHLEQPKNLFNVGNPLSPKDRGYFEPRFGQDFSNVRIHTDSTASRNAEILNARAFTLGNNIAFGRGEFRPQTNSGKRLIAHELTHVVQQRHSSSEDSIQRCEVDIELEEVTPERERDLRSQGIDLPEASPTSTDPTTRNDYIDNRARSVTWGLIPSLVNGGAFLIQVEGIEHMVALSESHVRLQSNRGLTAEPINNAIYTSYADAEAALPAGPPHQTEPIAYYWGAGGRVIAPTLFTPETTPRIVSTMRSVLREVSRGVTRELSVIGLVLAGVTFLRVIAAGAAAMVGRSGGGRGNGGGGGGGTVAAARIPRRLTLREARIWAQRVRDLSEWLRDLSRIRRIEDLAERLNEIRNFIQRYGSSTGTRIEVVPRHQAPSNLGPSNWGTWDEAGNRILIHEDAFTGRGVDLVQEIAHEVGAAELKRLFNVSKEHIPEITDGGILPYLTHVLDTML